MGHAMGEVMCVKGHHMGGVMWSWVITWSWGHVWGHPSDNWAPILRRVPYDQNSLSDKVSVAGRGGVNSSDFAPGTKFTLKFTLRGMFSTGESLG